MTLLQPTAIMALPQSMATQIRQLAKPAARQATNSLLVEGVKCCKELLNSDRFKVECIVCNPNDFSPAVEQIVDTAQRRGLPVYTTKAEKFAGLCDTKSPQGILAIAKHLQQPSLQPGQSFVALDNVSDPGNVGTIIRTCEWFGIGQVLLIGNCADYRAPKVIRATMGSAFRMNIVAIENNPAIFQEHFSTMEIFAATLGGPLSVRDIKPKQPFGLIVGSEAHGVSPALAGISTCFHIPGCSQAESLNVATATGIALYALTS